MPDYRGGAGAVGGGIYAATKWVHGAEIKESVRSAFRPKVTEVLRDA